MPMIFISHAGASTDIYVQIRLGETLGLQPRINATECISAMIT